MLGLRSAPQSSIPKNVDALLWDIVEHPALSDLYSLVDGIQTITDSFYKALPELKSSRQSVATIFTANIKSFREFLLRVEDESDNFWEVSVDVNYILEQSIESAPVRDIRDLVNELAPKTFALASAARLLVEKLEVLQNELNATHELLVAPGSTWERMFGSSKRQQEIPAFKHLRKKLETTVDISHQHSEYWSEFNRKVRALQTSRRRIGGTLTVGEVRAYSVRWHQVGKQYREHERKARSCLKILDLSLSLE